MINGNSKEFIELVYNGHDLFFNYDGHKYMFDGYSTENGFKHVIYDLNYDNKLFYEYEDDDSVKCGDAFQKANIFNGKSFWEVEQNIEWLDE